MKIVHVTQYFHAEKGYQENNLAYEQTKLGYQVTIICSDDLTLWAKNKYEKESLLSKDHIFTKQTGVKVIRLKKRFKISGRIFAFGLQKAIKNENPQILFLHGVYLPLTFIALLTTIKNKKNSVKVIVDDHMVYAGSFNKYSNLLYKLFRPSLKLLLKLSQVKVSKWIAVSYETKQFMMNNYGLDKEIEIIPLGFNAVTCHFDPEGAESWRIKNNLPESYKYILYIGKCDNYKNPIDLFIPFKNYIESKNDIALLIVGEMNDDYRSLILRNADLLNITEKIFIRPPVNNSEIRKVLSLANMVIWPHGSSMTMLEAMVCHCPVIAPESNVNKERLENLRGLMFKNLQSDLLEQMKSIDDNRDQLIMNAKEWVSQYSWENINKKFLSDLN